MIPFVSVTSQGLCPFLGRWPRVPVCWLSLQDGWPGQVLIAPPFTPRSVLVWMIKRCHLSLSWSSLRTRSPPPERPQSLPCRGPASRLFSYSLPPHSFRAKGPKAHPSRLKHVCLTQHLVDNYSERDMSNGADPGLCLRRLDGVVLHCFPHTPPRKALHPGKWPTWCRGWQIRGSGRPTASAV